MDEIISKADKNLMSVIEQCCTGITWEQAGKVKKASKCPFFSADDTRFYVWPEKGCWITYGGINERGGVYILIEKCTTTPIEKCTT